MIEEHLLNLCSKAKCSSSIIHVNICNMLDYGRLNHNKCTVTEVSIIMYAFIQTLTYNRRLSWEGRYCIVASTPLAAAIPPHQSACSPTERTQRRRGAACGATHVSAQSRGQGPHWDRTHVSTVTAESPGDAALMCLIPPWL